MLKKSWQKLKDYIKKYWNIFIGKDKKFFTDTDEFKKALDWVKSKGFEVKSQSNEYEVEFDGDRAYYPKIKFHFDANKFDTE